MTDTHYGCDCDKYNPNCRCYPRETPMTDAGTPYIDPREPQPGDLLTIEGRLRRLEAELERQRLSLAAHLQGHQRAREIAADQRTNEGGDDGTH